MRLAYEEQLTISDTIHQADADAMIDLFGSRADDTAKGGDIGLLVLSKRINLMTPGTTAPEAKYTQDRHCHISRYHPPLPQNSYADRSAVMTREKIELLSPASRFARLADLLIQRLIGEIELVGGRTILDCIYRAEKRGWAVVPEVIAYANNITR